MPLSPMPVAGRRADLPRHPVSLCLFFRQHSLFSLITRLTLCCEFSAVIFSVRQAVTEGLGPSEVIRSWKKFSTTYQIVSFFCFFSPDLYMKFSKFSKIVHTIFIKFCTVILHPAFSKASKLYDPNVSNIAKISPKTPKIIPKTAIFRLFSIP